MNSLTGNIQSQPSPLLFNGSVVTIITASYLRPGGIDTYHRPGGIDTYKRP